jgi:type VI secretion system VasD/TssJ family lipoprotein
MTRVRTLPLVPALLLGLLGPGVGCGGSTSDTRGQQPVLCTSLPIELFVQPGGDVNPNEKGQAEPVEVKVFLLKDRQTFDQLAFETIQRSGDRSVGPELLKSYSLTIYPARDEILPIAAPMNVSFVAVVGLFRNPTEGSWRYVFDVTDLARKCTPGGLHATLHTTIRKWNILPGQ